MPSLNHHISVVQNAPDKGTANRAQSLTKRTIAAYLNSARLFLISKDVEKQDSFPVALQQDLGCIPLECVDEADCCCVGWEWGDDVKKLTFPPVAELKENAGIAFFGLIDKKTQIYLPSQIYGELDEFLRFKGNNYRKAQMIGNDTIYLRGEGVRHLKTVNLRGIFKDPLAVNKYGANGDCKCYDWDNDNYPIPADLENAMYTIVWQTYIAPFVGLPRDNTNNEANKAVA